MREFGPLLVIYELYGVQAMLLWGEGSSFFAVQPGATCLLKAIQR
jgi:hypothetical protein